MPGQHRKLQQSLPPPLGCKLQWSLASKIISGAWGKMTSFSSSLPQLFTAGTESQAHAILDIDSLAQNSWHKYRSFIIFFALGLLKAAECFFKLCTFRLIPSAHCSRETQVYHASELPCFSLLQGMLFCQRIFRKCFSQSLRQSNMGTGGESFFFQPACEGINQGAGQPAARPTSPSSYPSFQCVSCHPTLTPHSHLTSEVTSSKQPVMPPWTQEKTAPYCKSDTKLSHPGKPAAVFDLWTFAAFLLWGWGPGERGEKGKGR